MLLYKDDASTAEFLKEQTACAREWPTDEAVTDAPGSSPLYRLLTGVGWDWRSKELSARCALREKLKNLPCRRI